MSVTLTKPILDGQARRIAAEWQSPMAAGIASLATSGAILESTDTEIRREIEWFSTRDQTSEYVTSSLHDLRALLMYVEDKGVRRPPFGWSDIWSDVPV
jgi:hypothetical protein